MSETFKYPNATSPTKTLTFESATGTDGHLMTDSEMLKKNQLQDVTIGGVRMVKNIGDDLHQWEYTVYVLASSDTYTDYDDVMDFIGSSYVNGAVNTFVWTDYNSTQRTVRMINDIIEIKTVGNYKRFTFVLEEVNT